jgi:hypothetical protein
MVSYNFDFVTNDDSSASRAITSGPSGLESITHLSNKICGIWGTAELDAFLNHLIMDARDGARNGLPVDVAAEILFLAQLNKIVRAIDLSVTLSIKLDEAYATVDDGDRARMRSDIFDDPVISRDTVVRSRSAGANGVQRSAAPVLGSQISGLLDLVLMLTRNRLLIGIIVITLGGKLLWPVIKPLL